MSCVVVQEILDRTGYSLDVTTGQRKYGGPPPGMSSTPPGPGHEVCTIHRASLLTTVSCLVSFYDLTQSVWVTLMGHIGLSG